MSDNIATPEAVKAALNAFLYGLSDGEKKQLLQSLLTMTQP